ncbi:MAG: PilZ domain-containing protein [Deltaproteobacteria bacterium]|nr:PilZ domain-containing protein [Deltaproteobacteria bacterium]
MSQKSAPKGVERRRSVRKDVLETFNVFVVFPKKGLRKLYLKDVSAGGIGVLTEAGDVFSHGDAVRCDFYINPTLKLPLSLKVAHVAEGMTGFEFDDTSTKAYGAFLAFMELLGQLAEFLE